MSEKVSLRVLVLCPQPYFVWRGSPLRVSFDVRALAELGHQVDLLTMPVGEEHPQEGVRHFRAPNFIRAKKLAIGPSAAKALLDGAILWKGWALARKNGYDVFHGIEDAGPIAALLAKRFKGKMVFEKHSDAASYKKGLVRNAVLGAYRAAERFSIRSADAVIGTGEALAEQARAVAPGKAVYAIHDIPSSLAEAGAGEVAAARAELGLPEGAVLALYVGSFAVYQGIDLLFEAAGRALAEEGRLHLAVVGGTEAEIAARRAELAARGGGVA
jgi:glycosyltransferase involved in cell wall biosynthesis